MKKCSIALIYLLSICSCSTFQPLTKKGQPITSEITTKIQAGKTYKFLLRSGQELVVRVKSVDSLCVYGTVVDKTTYDYKDTFESMVVNTKSIKVKKFSVIGTAAAIVIPIGLIGIAAAGAAAEGISGVFIK